MSGGCSITFDAGTLLVRGDDASLDPVREFLLFDERVGCHRAEACSYSAMIRALTAAGIPIDDKARNYKTLSLTLHSPHMPMPHQLAALRSWNQAKRRGVVVMPTGSGKTFFAFLAMKAVQRSALVVVPTIDLLHQWASQLERAFGEEIGMLGGGSHDIRDITVSTYDSAVLRMDAIGDKFGLIIFDECHHLPGPVNRLAASLCLAPYRLGLTATPESGSEEGAAESLAVLEKVLGSVVYRVNIDELEGTVLATYVTRRIQVELTPEESQAYQAARRKYINFVRSAGIDFRDRNAWSRFAALCFRRPGGRDVFDAFLTQRMIARCGSGKLTVLWKIVRDNPGARILIFTADNGTAYRIGERLCLPVITHKTKAAERKEFLDSFRTGEYPVLVTSKVLNEGVDVPEANIAIVVSGSGSIREHVQRLGRILRRTAEGKQAVLYELVSAGTSEMSVSERRRNHRAYQTLRHLPMREGPPSC